MTPIKIDGMPDFVKIHKNGRWHWAEINLSEIQYKENITRQIGEAILKLSDLGFVYSNTSHQLGYYDSVEDITMEFNTPSKPKRKK